MADMDAPEHPATRMITVLDWWLKDHFDNGRNTEIEARIHALQLEIQLQIDADNAHQMNKKSGPIAICNYCITANECRAINRCAMEESRRDREVGGG